MYQIDRGMALIKPKQAFLDWLKALPGSELDITLEQLRGDCTSVLLPLFSELEEALAAIDEIYDEIFEMELSSWSDEESLWPSERTVQLFWEWFDVELHSLVVDAMEDIPEAELP
ncbi:MAG: hypothetical protein M0T84_16560 [Betaproteobacteria bacterium]|nr:hypothetical protein [Betaproteobacteria bacterium]